MADAIRGFWVAAPTPLDAAGAVDHGALARHARRLFDADADGIVLFGTTGEGTSFGGAERLAATEALLAAGVPAERIGLGAGFPAVTESVALTRAALALGLTQVLLLPPFFYRDASPEGIADAFAAVLDGVADARLRATLYHIPQVAGIGVPPAVAARLRARYGAVVAGLKDSSADFTQFRAFRAAAPDLAVTVGNEPDIARAMAEGGAGTICGMANVVPGTVRALVTGQADTAAISAALSVMAGAPFVPTLKAILAAQTGEAGWLRVRPPLRALPDGTALKARLDALPRPRAA